MSPNRRQTGFPTTVDFPEARCNSILVIRTCLPPLYRDSTTASSSGVLVPADCWPAGSGQNNAAHQLQARDSPCSPTPALRVLSLSSPPRVVHPATLPRNKLLWFSRTHPHTRHQNQTRPDTARKKGSKMVLCHHFAHTHRACAHYWAARGCEALWTRAGWRDAFGSNRGRAAPFSMHSMDQHRRLHSLLCEANLCSYFRPAVVGGCITNVGRDPCV